MPTPAVEELQFPGEIGGAGTAMIEQQFGDFAGSVLARPVVLQFEGENHPGQRHRTCLDHPLDAHFMRFRADAARGIVVDR